MLCVCMSGSASLRRCKMYKRDLLHDITEEPDMRHYKGMMKNIRATACGIKYCRESGGANHGDMNNRPRRSF